MLLLCFTVSVSHSSPYSQNGEQQSNRRNTQKTGKRKQPLSKIWKPHNLLSGHWMNTYRYMQRTDTHIEILWSVKEINWQSFECENLKICGSSLFNLQGGQDDEPQVGPIAAMCKERTYDKIHLLRKYVSVSTVCLLKRQYKCSPFTFQHTVTNPPLPQSEVWSPPSAPDFSSLCECALTGLYECVLECVNMVGCLKLFWVSDKKKQRYYINSSFNVKEKK